MIKKVVRRQYNSKNCFVCGKTNEVSFKADFFDMDDDSLVALATAGERHQSYPGIVHGGASAALLDETMGRAITTIDMECIGITLELNYKYHRPVPPDVQLIISARVVENGPKVYISEGELILPDGTRAVTARGVFLKSDPEILSRMGAEFAIHEMCTSPDDPTEIDIPDPLEMPVKIRAEMASVQA